MSKVAINDGKVWSAFQKIASGFFAVLAGVLIFVDLPSGRKLQIGVMVLLALILVYLVVWRWANRVKQVKLKIEGSTVHVKVGDIFKECDFKAIAFNDFFDTQVDDVIIAKATVNGQFIETVVGKNLPDLNAALNAHNFEPDEIVGQEITREKGRRIRVHPGTIFVYGDYLLTAFAKFSDQNRAELTMPEYLEFLINFWDKVNGVYAQKSVATTIFGSGITRIKGHRTISDEDLLKIMLWTFRISEMRFKHPAKLTIVIHPSKIDEINLLDIAGARNGL